ncbi:hypothetical protein PIB30_099246, partial [Stylosanthes scabra]|nr:hypothetical protein [Stylosanthes scabra]
MVKEQKWVEWHKGNKLMVIGYSSRCLEVNGNSVTWKGISHEFGVNFEDEILNKGGG